MLVLGRLPCTSSKKTEIINQHCSCQKIRSVFRVPGVYNFDLHLNVNDHMKKKEALYSSLMIE